MAKVTIQEVARAAGVSKGTVSRVLNGREGVNTATRAGVLEVVERLGFRPDPDARRLARQGRHLVGLAPFPGDSLSVPYYGVLLDSLQECFLGEGYAARVLEPGPDGLPEGDADGLILLGVRLGDPRFARLAERGTPFVAVGEGLGGGSWVDVDNAGGLREAVRHLARLGHRRIAHLTGASAGQATEWRLEGYRAGLREAGLSEDRRLVWNGGFTELGGYRAVRGALAEGVEFSAVAAASDEMALGAIAALEDAGLRVPWDVSVTGFDDLPGSQGVSPPLTTVRQPIREVGRRAAALLLERLGGGEPRTERLPVQLVVRASSAIPVAQRLDSS